MNSTATVYEQYCYSDNCPLPFSKTLEMKKKKRKEKKRNADVADAGFSTIQTAPTYALCRRHVVKKQK